MAFDATRGCNGAGPTPANGWCSYYDGATTARGGTSAVLATSVCRMPGQPTGTLAFGDGQQADFAFGPQSYPAVWTWSKGRRFATSYRARLESLSEARLAAAGDPSRLVAIDAEHDALVAELGRTSDPAGRTRSLGSSTAERARKAVAARIRDAVGRIEEVLPGMAEHLDRTLVTGVRCRYTGDVTWQVVT